MSLLTIAFLVVCFLVWYSDKSAELKARAHRAENAYCGDDMYIDVPDGHNRMQQAIAARLAAEQSATTKGA